MFLSGRARKTAVSLHLDFLIKISKKLLIFFYLFAVPRARPNK